MFSPAASAKRILAAVVLGLVSGVLLAAPNRLGVTGWLTVGGCGCGLAALLVWRQKQKPLLGCICLAAFALGFWQAVWVTGQKHISAKPQLTDKEVVAVIVKLREDSQPVGAASDFVADAILLRHRQEQAWEPVSFGVKVRAPGSQSFASGDVLLMHGKLQKPRNFSDFDHVDYTSYYPRLTWLENGSPLWRRWLASVRKYLEGRINSWLPEPHASLLAGLLVGARRGFPAQLKTDFKKAGLTHIVAVSGSNIAMVVIAISALTRFLPGLLQLTVSVLAIIAFALLTGAEASVVRAAIMGVFALLAISFGRNSSSTTALLLAVAIMLWLSPELVCVDVGFQLSFAATAGLIYLSGPIERRLTFVPEFLGLRSVLACTLAAQLATMPLTVYHFQYFSPVAPLANILAVPLVPYAMVAGVAMLVASYVSFLPTWLVSGPVWLLLHAIVNIAQGFARILG